ncbi:MAG: recombination mediator RecR [Oscillospiraceae bacterium]|nr:recombination mediator RecR [Oscillospiraceae bacterium]
MSPGSSPTLEALIQKFRSLPGIGGKTAVRLAFFMLNSSDDYVNSFSECILAAKTKITVCQICQNISDGEICGICSDERRDKGLVCIVESARDILTFEKVKEYNGVYHVLHGVISPMDGINAEDIRVKELVNRVTGSEIKINEIILATPSNVEGEVTASYISKLIKPFGVMTTRLAYGIPVGGELEYADSVTLFKALEGRREM